MRSESLDYICEWHPSQDSAESHIRTVARSDTHLCILSGHIRQEPGDALGRAKGQSVQKYLL